MDNKVKVLVVRFSSIGDIVLTTPIVRCLKEQLHGNVEVHYLTKSVYAPILAANPYINKIHTIEKSATEVIEELKSLKFDYVVDLHKNIRSAQVKRHLKVMVFTFNKLNVEKWLLVNFGINKLPNIHIVDRYFEAVKALSVKNDGKGLDYFIPKNDEVNLAALDQSLSDGYIAFAIGGKFSGKKLPIEKQIEICKLIKFPIILMGGPEDDAAASKIIDAAGSHCYNACGKFNINQSASIIAQSKMVITHDTGLMHIASAFKKNIVSIWGATVPEFGMDPYLPGEASEIIQASHLKYRPTSKLGNRNSKKELRTMQEIDSKVVVTAVEKILMLSR